MVRTLLIHAVAFDQVDLFQGDFFTRVTGLTTSNISVAMFYNNTVLPWTLVTGSGVADEQVVSGFLYFNELAVSGYYGLRFKPNATGLWRIVVNYTAGVQTVALDYDVMQPYEAMGGLKASLIKPG